MSQEPGLEHDLELQDRVRAMLEHCQLVNVLIIQMSAERFGPADPATATVTSRVQYLVDEDTFANRYEWHADIRDADSEALAELHATLLVDYETQAGFRPDGQAAEAIAVTTGYFAAYPYVRELFQSHCARLQLDPIVLGMLLAPTDPIEVTNPQAIGADRGEPGRPSDQHASC